MMVGKGGRSDRSVSTGRVAVGRYVLDVGKPEGMVVSTVRVRRASQPADLAAALAAEERPATQVAEEAIEDAGEVTDKVERAATLFEKVVSGQIDAATIGAELERLVALLGRLDRAGRYEDALALARVLARLLSLTARWSALVGTLRIAARAAGELADSDALGWVLHELGTLALGADDAQAAMRDLGEARRLRESRGDSAGLAATKRNLRAARWPLAPRAIRIMVAALVLGVILALVIAGGDHPGPPPTTDAATDTTVAPPPPPPPPPAGDPAAPKPTLELAPTRRRASAVAGLTNDPTPALTGTAGTGAGHSTTIIVKIYRGKRATGGDPLQERPSARDADGRYEVRARALPSGTYTAQAQQRDDAGNTGRSDAVTFTVDLEPPRLAIGTPKYGATTDESPIFSGAAGQADGDEPVIELTLSSEPQPIAVPVAQDGTWSREIGVPSVLEDPEYKRFTAIAKQTDRAGNAATAMVTFTPEPDVVE